jgi:hypothetical protein
MAGTDRPEPASGGAEPTEDSPEAAFRGVDAAVVLPTLNEEAGLGRTFADIPLGALESAGWKVRPLVVDGGSTDRTREVARALGVPVLRQKSRGKGAAVREALQWLRERGVRYAVVLDADCTYPGEAIGPTLSLLASGSQLVVGVRYPVQTPLVGLRDLVHRIGNAFLNFVASRVSQHPILDLCSGFYGVDLALVMALELDSTGFEIEAELFLKAYRGGLTVTQIPIAYRQRVGEAKLRAARDGTRIFFTTLRCGRLPLRNPVPERSPASPLVRELLSVCFVHASRELVVLCPLSREPEAHALVARLRGSGIAARVQPGLLAPPRLGTLADTAVRGEGHDGVPATVVALPSIRRPPVPRATEAVALLPRSRRLVYLGRPEPPKMPRRGGARTPLSPVATPPQEAFVLEFANDRRHYLDPLRALGASLSPSTVSKELALLEANGLRSSVTVWRLREREDGPEFEPFAILPELEPELGAIGSPTPPEAPPIAVAARRKAS